MKGGDVIYEFKGDTKDVEDKAKGLDKNLKNIAKSGAKVLGGIATAATTALVGVTKKAVEMRGEIEQQVGGTEAVFKEFAKTVQEDSTKAFDTMGISASDYMAYMNKMGSLMQGSGIETKKSMELSSQAMQRAADVASIMGISVEDAMTAIAGAAKGNFTMMDNLGVAMNATSLNAYALEKGLNKTYATMTQGEKIELAMQMFLEKSAYAAGNYAKENDTFAGSLNTLKAAAQNLLAGTGSVDQVMSALTNFGKILVENLKTILPQVVEGIIGLINGIIPLLPDLIKAILPSLLKGIVDLTLAIIEILPELIMMIADVLPDLLPQIVDAILIIIPELAKYTPQFIEAGIKLVGAIVKGIILSIVTLLKGIGELAAKGIAKLKEKFSGKSILEIGIELVKGLWNGINNMNKWIIDKIKGFGKSILNGIKGIFGIKSPSKEFAIIGKFNVLGLEKGMEDEARHLQTEFDSMFDLSPSLYGTSSLNLSPNVTVVNNIQMKQDALGQMVNDIKTFSGGAKNDYSYGMGA